MTKGLRLLVFDRTCRTSRGKLPLGLSHAWGSGSLLYRGLGRIDASFGATSWSEALDWLAAVRAPDPIAEIQYWGHGKWGRVLVDEDGLGSEALKTGHRLFPKIEAVRERFVPDALFWLRTCEAFGASEGHEFAQRLADGLGARVAGHTFVIGAVQSGLHGLLPGHRPDWSAGEGLAEGTPEAPKKAHDSSPTHPRTITCFDGKVPDDWFA
jgi:hypothetical protein